MKKDAGTSNAANTKTLNAVEKERLYAAAGAEDPEVNRTEMNGEDEAAAKDWSETEEKSPGEKAQPEEGA